MMQISRIKKYLLWTAGVVLAVFLLLVIVVWARIAALDMDEQRARLETRASELLARNVRINGPLILRPSLYPRFSVANVSIANPDWATSREFLSVKKFEVAISILALLQGELVLTDVELVGATLHLQRGDNQDTTWSFRRSAKPKSPSDRMLDIVALHAKDILIVYYPADRPAVSVRIDELHASLEQDEPIELQLKGAIRELPVDIALQGGTLAELLDVNQQWRFRGQLDTDFRKIDFAGHITDLFRLHGMELRVSSDIQQQHWVKFLGRSIEPLVDRYHAHLSVNNDAGFYEVKLTGGFYGFDLSRLYEKKQRQQKTALKFDSLTIQAQSAGKTVGELLQAAAINISVADIEYQKPVNKPAQKYYTAQLDALSIKTGETEDLEMRLQGSVNRIPVNLRAVSGKILYALWKNQDAMLDMDVQAGDANAHFSGGISRPLQHFVLAGQLSLKAGGLDKIGALFAGNWPGSAALQATGDVHYSDKILAFNNLQAQLGTQPLNGDAMLKFGNEIELSLQARARQFDIHDVMPSGKVAEDFVFKLQDFDLSIQGKHASMLRSVLDGRWQIKARQGDVGRRSATGNADYVYALRDIHMEAREQLPMTLMAQGSHNGLEMKFSAEADRIENLFNRTQPFAFKLHLAASDVAASLQGAVQKPLSAINIAGDLAVQGQLPEIGQLINTRMSYRQSADLRGHLAITRGDFAFTDIVARTDGVVVNGNVVYRGSTSPRLSINSTGSRIDLAEYLDQSAQPEKMAVNTAPRKERIIPDLALDFVKYRSLDAQIDIRDLNIQYKNSPITLINARFTAANGMFRFDPLELRSAIHHSNSIAKIEFDSVAQPHKAMLNLQVNNINFGEILKKMEVTDQVVGVMNLHVDLNGQGNNLREVMGNANGNIQLVADKGAVPKWVLELWGGGLFRIFIPTTWTEDSVTNLNCAVGQFDVLNGVMRSKVLLADTTRVTVAGEVIVNWQNEQLGGLFKPQSKEATLFSLGTPLKLGGTLAYPSVGAAESGIKRMGKWVIGLTYPASLIVMFGDVGAEEKNPCAALLVKTGN